MGPAIGILVVLDPARTAVSPCVLCDRAASVVPTGNMLLYVVQVVTRDRSKLLGVLR